VKTGYKFQLLILWATIPLMILLSSCWSWHITNSVYDTILAGFDRKLLAMSGSLAALIDPDAHERYQAPKSVTLLADGPEGRLFGFDATKRTMLLVDKSDGGSRVLHPWSGPLPSSMAFDTSSGQLHLLVRTEDKTSLLNIPTPLVSPEGVSVTLESPLDGIYLDNHRLFGWSASEHFEIDPQSGRLTRLTTPLGEAVRSLVPYGATGCLVGLSPDGRSLLVLTRDGKLTERVPLKQQDAEEEETLPELAALAYSGGRLYATGPSLVELDAELGLILTKGFSTGYFSENDPFFVRYRGPLTVLRRQAGLTFLYTYEYLGGNNLRYMLDGTVGPGHSLPGALDQAPDEATIEGNKQVQYLGRPWVSAIQSWDQWGLLKTASFPIQNEKGRTVAIAGADVDITIIREKTRWALAAVFLVGGIFLVMAILLSLWIVRSLLRPLHQLKEMALRIAAGDYAYVPRGTVGGETAFLSKTLLLLANRLSGQRSKAKAARQSLQERRRRLALAGALEERFSGTTTLLGEQRIAGRHRRGDIEILWVAAAADDELSVQCLRARILFQAEALLKAESDPQRLCESILDSFPSVSAVAHWQSATGLLHHASREPVQLRQGADLHSLTGTGVLPLVPGSQPEWEHPHS